MVCNQHDDKMWTLSNGGMAARMMASSQSGGVGALLSKQNSVGVAGGVGLVLVAAVGLAVRQRAVELQQVGLSELFALFCREGCMLLVCMCLPVLLERSCCTTCPPSLARFCSRILLNTHTPHSLTGARCVSGSHRQQRRQLP